METLLSMVRSNEITADAKIIDALLAGVDLLRTMLDNVQHQQEIDISKAMRRLNQLLTRRVSQETQMDLKKEVPLTDINGKETGFTLNEFQRKNLPRINCGSSSSSMIFINWRKIKRKALWP